MEARMNLFRADRKRQTYRGTVIRMVIIAAVFAIVLWIRVTQLPDVKWYGSLFYTFMLLALYTEFVCFCELIFTSDNRQLEAFRTGTARLKWPPVVCDMSCILKLLRDTWPDGGTVLFVRHDNIVYRIGVVSDYNKRQGFFDQAYVIEDRQFDTEQEFLSYPLKDGVTLADISSLTILSADDSNPKPLLDSLC